jgi:hypothetical protein
MVTHVAGAVLLGTAVFACGDANGDAAPSGGMASPAPFVLVSGTAAARASTVRAAGVAVAAATPQAIAADDEVWRRIAAETEASLRPLLRPPSPPAGLETVLSTPGAEDGNRGFFSVEYAGPGKLLVITAGLLSRPPGFEPGHQDQVTVRGQAGVLAVGDDRDPHVSSWVYWEEPGMWRPEGAESVRPRVMYLVRGQGMSPKELLALVEGLRPWEPE